MRQGSHRPFRKEVEKNCSSCIESWTRRGPSMSLPSPAPRGPDGAGEPRGKAAQPRRQLAGDPGPGPPPLPPALLRPRRGEPGALSSPSPIPPLRLRPVQLSSASFVSLSPLSVRKMVAGGWPLLTRASWQLSRVIWTLPHGRAEERVCSSDSQARMENQRKLHY